MSTITLDRRKVRIVHCYKCDWPIALPGRAEEALLESKENFWCAQGHPQRFAKSTSTRLQEQIDAANARAERIESEKKRAIDERNAARAAVSRLKNRASAGVCPCCNRTFVALARHMKAKHPEYGAGHG